MIRAACRFKDKGTAKAFENKGFLTPGGDRGLIFLPVICKRQFYTSWRGERQNAFNYVNNDLFYTVTMCIEVVMGVFKLPKCLYQSFTFYNYGCDYSSEKAISS